tara:strand:- start:1482 stop:1673 length:192 start_codon:yes stop_codon:yes gene_type:complete
MGFNTATIFGDRLRVGQLVLVQPIQVRILVPEPKVLFNVLCIKKIIDNKIFARYSDDLINKIL